MILQARHGWLEEGLAYFNSCYSGNLFLAGGLHHALYFAGCKIIFVDALHLSTLKSDQV